MWQFVLRRLLYTIPVLWGVFTIVFVLFNLVATNPIYTRLPKNATAEEITRLEQQFGLDRPLVVQYFDYLADIVRLDFGRSWETQQRVRTMIWEGIGPTLTLMIPSFLLASILAVAIGLWVSHRHRTWVDRSVVLLSVLGMSVSILAFIIGGQYFLAFQLGLYPISGFEYGLKGLPYLGLPMLIWVLAYVGEDVRFYRSAFLEEMNRDYVTTGRAKGLSEAVILFRHILKNAMLPVITRMVTIVPHLFVGSILLESYFGIPGLGDLSFNALNASDFPVIQAVTIFGAIIYVFSNLVGDILYSWFDPRVRLR